MSWTWAFFAVYAVATAYLAWRGGKDAGSAAGFALGSGHMNPWVAGVTLGACLASSATFVIVPGFVYAEGLPALVGFTLPFLAGLGVGLLLFAPRFQSFGARVKALTIPHWLGERYRSEPLRRLFAGLNVLSLAYLVLIVVGCAYVMERALGVPYAGAVIGIVAFVFGYTGFGGATAHAFTNTLQGLVMLGVSVIILVTGTHLWPQAAESLLASGWSHVPGSPLFSSPWEVWVVPFFMGILLCTQPHLLAKALYVQGRKDLSITIGTGMGCYAVYSLVLSAGAYARVVLPADIPQDQVMAAYLAQAIPWEPLAALVTVAILAASMSTLDGLLVALAASIAGDLFPGRGQGAWLQRVVLVLLAIATIAVSLSPPSLVLILGQKGVNGLVAAAAGPLLVGLFTDKELDGRWAIASALTAVSVHFGLGLWFTNPQVTSLFGVLAGAPLALMAASRVTAPVAEGSR